MAQALRPTATNPGARRVAPHGQGPQPPTVRPPVLAPPGSFAHPPTPEGPPLLRLLQDPSRTVAVFFFQELPDGHPFLQLCRGVALALRGHPGMAVCPMDVGRPANAPVFQSLQRPNGPVKKSVPRIVVYPKGNKEGLKLKGVKRAIPPVEAVLAFMAQADRTYPGRSVAAAGTVPVPRPYIPANPQTAHSPRRLSLPGGEGMHRGTSHPSLHPTVTKKGGFASRVPSIFRSKSTSHPGAAPAAAPPPP
eukprot:EG_transcript_26111